MSQPSPRPAIRWLVFVVGAGVVVGVGTAFWSLRMAVAAESICQVMEAGGRFGYTLFVFPAFSGFLATLVIAPASLFRLLGRWPGWIGLAIGLVAVVAVTIYYLTGIPGDIARGGGLDFCPAGMAPNWPSWLVR